MTFPLFNLKKALLSCLTVFVLEMVVFTQVSLTLVRQPLALCLVRHSAFFHQMPYLRCLVILLKLHFFVLPIGNKTDTLIDKNGNIIAQRSV